VLVAHPFSAQSLAELDTAFAIRRFRNIWCGYAMLDSLPAELSNKVVAPLPGPRLCAVLFMKAGAGNQFLICDRHGSLTLIDSVSLACRSDHSLRQLLARMLHPAC
jgi:hypothetical protein